MGRNAMDPTEPFYVVLRRHFLLVYIGLRKVNWTEVTHITHCPIYCLDVLYCASFWGSLTVAYLIACCEPDSSWGFLLLILRRAAHASVVFLSKSYIFRKIVRYRIWKYKIYWLFNFQMKRREAIKNWRNDIIAYECDCINGEDLNIAKADWEKVGVNHS